MLGGTPSCQPCDMQHDRRATLICVICGSQLEGDPDDQKDLPLGPICGECHRAREFDETLWERDLAHDLGEHHGDGW